MSIEVTNSEGAARNSRKESLNFLSISPGSLAEVETQLIPAERLGYCDGGDELEHVNKSRRIILGLRNHLRKHEQTLSQEVKCETYAEKATFHFSRITHHVSRLTFHV